MAGAVADFIKKSRVSLSVNGGGPGRGVHHRIALSIPYRMVYVPSGWDVHGGRGSEKHEKV